MDILTNRTAEVEQKLKAIHIDTRDGCSFWRARHGTLVEIRQCWYCAYASFDRENPDIHQKGLCQYKQCTAELTVPGAKLHLVADGYFADGEAKKRCPQCGAVMNLEWQENHGCMMQVYQCRSCGYKVLFK